MQLFFIVLGSLTVVGIIGVLLYLLWDTKRSVARVTERREDREIADRRHADSIAEITSLALVADGLVQIRTELEAKAESFERVPVLIEGLQAMAHELAKRTDSLNGATELLQSSMTPSTDKEDYDEYAEDTPAAKRAAAREEVKDLVRRGIPVQEAEQRVKDRTLWDGFAMR